MMHHYQYLRFLQKEIKARAEFGGVGCLDEEMIANRGNWRAYTKDNKVDGYGATAEDAMAELLNHLLMQTGEWYNYED